MIALILPGIAIQVWLARTGRLVAESVSETSRRSYAAAVFVLFMLAAALGRSAYPIRLAIAMAMLVYYKPVRYRWKRT